MPTNSKLLSFVKEAKTRGYSDSEIRKALLNHGWKEKDIQKAFESLTPKSNLTNQVCIFLNEDIQKTLQKRAKRNLFTISEQIEDILRRSCMIKRKSSAPEKIDDFLISCFSRKKK